MLHVNNIFSGLASFVQCMLIRFSHFIVNLLLSAIHYSAMIFLIYIYILLPIDIWMVSILGLLKMDLLTDTCDM